MIIIYTKRFVVNEHVKVPKKTHTYVISIAPGKHPKKEAVPAGYLIRDMLKYALSYKETRKAVAKKFFYVDGKLIKSVNTPIGLMDVVYVVPTGEKYRVSYNDKGILSLVKIDAKESKLKLGKIKFKKLARGKKIQLTLHDGRNFFLDYEEGNKYKVGDSILFEIENQKIKEHLPLKENALIMIIGGRWRGKIAKLKEIIDVKGLDKNKVVLEDEEGNTIRTLKDYVFVIGDKEPVLKVK